MHIDPETEIEMIDGRRTTFAEFEGKVVLVVNTATQCGFTPQLEGLEGLHEKYEARGLVVLGCPSGQFFQQPGEGQEIEDVCKRRYGVTFPLTAKLKVNGGDAHPLFVQLKKGAPGFLGLKAIKWNFTKFLVDHEGEVVERFGTKTTPAAIEPKIEALLVTRAESLASAPTAIAED